ncbi:MAG: AI-2E family transporter [DPANN group archaeon]|nr:AI-2E family transporter [DPANN group archaeon]
MAEPVKYDTIFFLIGIAAGLLLILPFFNSLIFAMIFALILYPAHKYLSKYINETWSAGLLTFFSMAIVIILLAVGTKIILEEIANVYFYFIGFDFSTIFPGRADLAASFEAISGFMFQKVISYSSTFISRLPGIIVSFAVFIFTLFFFIRDGEKALTWIEKNLQLPINNKKEIFRDIKNYIHAFVNVWLAIGAVQALMATLGFYLFGIPYPIIAGLLAGILSILPSVGPFALYFPVGLYYISIGNPIIGVGIMIYGFIIGSVLDYIIRPYLASKWSNAHPVLIFLGVFGGLAFLGPAGFIVGPIILLVAVSFLKELGLKKITS